MTFYSAIQEQQCEESFEKRCQITFRSKAVTEPVGQEEEQEEQYEEEEQEMFFQVRSCRRPLVSVCDGSGPEKCREEQETVCRWGSRSINIRRKLSRNRSESRSSSRRRSWSRSMNMRRDRNRIRKMSRSHVPAPGRWSSPPARRGQTPRVRGELCPCVGGGAR